MATSASTCPVSALGSSATVGFPIFAVPPRGREFVIPSCATEPPRPIANTRSALVALAQAAIERLNPPKEPGRKASPRDVRAFEVGRGSADDLPVERRYHLSGRLPRPHVARLPSERHVCRAHDLDANGCLGAGRWLARSAEEARAVAPDAFLATERQADHVEGRKAVHLGAAPSGWLERPSTLYRRTSIPQNLPTSRSATTSSVRRVRDRRPGSASGLMVPAIGERTDR